MSPFGRHDVLREGSKVDEILSFSKHVEYFFWSLIVLFENHIHPKVLIHSHLFRRYLFVGDQMMDISDGGKHNQ